jgi:acyl-CoA thioester hydrolase
MTRRKKRGHFEREEGAPSPLSYTVQRRVAFNEVDVMGIAWHGRYAVYFEEASSELRRRCGLSYKEFFEAALRAPIVEFHIDYHRPVRLDEELSVTASLIWTEAARLNIEYELTREDGTRAVTGYTVQLFIDSETGEPCIASPDLLERCRQRWQAGDYASLQ